MELQEKERIAEALEKYIFRIGGRAKAVASLRVSRTTIALIMRGRRTGISNEMWRSIAAQIGHRKHSWVPVETENFKMLTALLKDSQEFSNVFAVIGDAGSGKSFTIRHYAEKNKRVYVLNCGEHWNRKAFMQELLLAMGRDCNGYNVVEMIDEAVRCLNQEDRPLIIMDEVDKLTDQSLYFFITLYNQLEDHCGIVMCATDHLKKKIKRGLKLNAKGYKEIYSRIGRKFIELEGVTSNDITSICVENGITGRGDVKEIVKGCEWDLRRVKRKIHALKQMETEMEEVEGTEEIVDKD